MILALTPAPAGAHSAVPGVAGFYEGLAVPVQEPALGLAALAFALLALHDFPRRLRAGWLACAVALAVGAAAGRALAATLPLEAALLALAAVAAGLAAVTGDRATRAALALLPLLGLAIGAAARPDPGPWRDVAVTTAGAATGAVLPLLVIGGGLDWLRERTDGPVLRIGLRVAASWLAAIALLIAAFVLRPG